MKLEKIISILRRLKLDSWSVLFEERRSCSLFLTHRAVETSIDALRTEATVTVYKRYGKEIGDARFIISSDDEAELVAKVKDALLLTAYAKKPAYPLPVRQTYSRVQLADPAIVRAFSAGKEEALVLKTWNLIDRAFTRERGMLLNSAELDLGQVSLTVANSAGLRATSSSTGLFVECIFTAFQGADKRRREQESLAATTVSRLSDFDAANFVRHHCIRSRDVLAAKNFTGVQHGKILLAEDALRDFWSPQLDVNPVVFHAAAAAAYKKLSRYELGKKVTANASFSIASNPAVPFNPASSVFDADGVASKPVTLIDKGVFVNHFGPQRYAHYLGVPATGGLGAIELSSGSERLASLLSDGCLEIVAFSSFSPNSMSGDFSAEIRLAYLHARGKKIPIRAAMFSGNLFQMLDAMRASKERVLVDRYHGPAAVRFDKNVTVSGF